MIIARTGVCSFGQGGSCFWVSFVHNLHLTCTTSARHSSPLSLFINDCILDPGLVMFSIMHIVYLNPLQSLSKMAGVLVNDQYTVQRLHNIYLACVSPAPLLTPLFPPNQVMSDKEDGMVPEPSQAMITQIAVRRGPVDPLMQAALLECLQPSQRPR